jgi:hypothetical protein
MRVFTSGGSIGPHEAQERQMRTTPVPQHRTDARPPARPPFAHATAVRGSFRSPKGKVGAMSGWLRLDRFVVAAEGLRAAGVFTGELVDADGTLVGIGSCRKTVPAEITRSEAGIAAAIGPVDVDLLGLLVTITPFTVEARVPVRAPEKEATVSPLRRTRGSRARRADR